MFLRSARKTEQKEHAVFGSGRNKIVYTVEGEGEPLLLVHGLSGSGRWWRHNLPVLAQSYACHIIELVGYGVNRALRPTRLETAAEALAQFISTLPTGRANVLGHSMGGQICTYLAAQHPERVEKLVLAAASGLVRSDVVRMAMRLPVAGHYAPLDFLPTLAMDALRAGPLNLFLSTLDILSKDTTELAQKITAPTLLIWGERDNLVPVAAGKAMEELIPNARFELIEGAGHVLMWDHPRTFNRLVLEFLKEDTPPPAG
jgi:Predicted hydrolases or acyltransferases (alpha/beta hydrolase superfamily)